MDAQPTRRVLFAGVAASLAALALPRPSLASTYPTRPIRVVIPSAPGGALDLTTRLVCQKMGERLGQPLVLDNRPGGDTLLGTRLVKEAPNDGYTLLSQASTFAARAAVYRDPGYDPVRDFVGIAPMIRSPLMLLTGMQKPNLSVPEIVAQSRARPGSLSFAASGFASPVGMSALKFMHATQIQMLHVPYRGNGPAMADLISGTVDLIFESPVSGFGYVSSGRARALAVTSDRRLPQLPDVPTFAELGFPGVVHYFWLGLLGTPGLPREAIERLSDSAREAVFSPDLRGRFTADGSEPMRQTPDEFTALIREEVAQLITIFDGLGMEKQ
jgi:tripartite-type tricarboxylate transporter receptor subunit TctC